MKKAIVGLACGAFVAASAASGTASAFVEGRYKTFAESYGNSNAYGGFSMNSSQQNSSGTVGVAIPNGIVISPYLSSFAEQRFDTNVKIFGIAAKPIVARLSAEAHWQTSDGSADVHTPKTSARVTVLGTQVYSSSGSSCGTGARCLSREKNYDQVFAEGKGKFMVWAVEVTVAGKVVGTAGAGFNANATAIPLNGEKWSLDGSAQATWSAYADLTAFFDVCVGYCEIAGLGVDGKIKLFNISVGPNARSTQSTMLNGDASYSWVNRASVDIETMSGEANVYSILPILGKDSARIVKWTGYTDSWKLWGYGGSTTCTDYRTRHYNDCRSEIF
jgi:hypothetical protein